MFVLRLPLSFLFYQEYNSSTYLYPHVCLIYKTKYSTILSWNFIIFIIVDQWLLTFEKDNRPFKNLMKNMNCPLETSSEKHFQKFVFFFIVFHRPSKVLLRTLAYDLWNVNVQFYTSVGSYKWNFQIIFLVKLHLKFQNYHATKYFIRRLLSKHLIVTWLWRSVWKFIYRNAMNIFLASCRIVLLVLIIFS